MYDALRKRGLQVPKHTSKVYSTITDDQQDDRIAFLPGLLDRLQNAGVYDMDKTSFPDLWEANSAQFCSYMKYSISDHRPFWMQVGV